ncbi:metallophosphoesterase family protein [Vibrio salilacus]|uniref:metallophosphoesterase family protein n=1 Tax=Vibrio salilacus TaxID=1323749 RepID=UPI000C2A135D|nr:metallophosphoesterase [Vibrio salilacus]
MSTVFQISDCHLSDKSSFYNLNKALIHANADESCDTILLTGDICCNPKPGDYNKLLIFIARQIENKQVFAIAGNHDDLALMKTELKGSLIRVVDKCRIAGRNFIFLDSSHKNIDSRHPLGSGRVDNRGIAHLKKQVRKMTQPIVVVHHPVIRVGSEWMQAICLENDHKIFNILKRSGVTDVICGHGHDYITCTKEGVTQYMAPATSYGFDHSIAQYNRNDHIGMNKITLSKQTITVNKVVL